MISFSRVHLLSTPSYTILLWPDTSVTSVCSRSRSRSVPDLTPAFRHNFADLVLGTDTELSCCSSPARGYKPGFIRVHSVRGRNLRRHPANVVFHRVPQSERTAAKGGRTTLTSTSPWSQEHHAGICFLGADQCSSNMGCGCPRFDP